MLTTARLNLAVSGALGVSLIAALAVHAGLAPIYRALDNVGWLGLAWVCMLQLVSMGFCAGAWKPSGRVRVPVNTFGCCDSWRSIPCQF